eukprot:3963550-Prymnesium_polylepis.2
MSKHVHDHHRRCTAAARRRPYHPPPDRAGARHRGHVPAPPQQRRGCVAQHGPNKPAWVPDLGLALRARP